MIHLLSKNVAVLSLHSRLFYEKIVKIKMAERPVPQDKLEREEHEISNGRFDRFMYQHGRTIANTASLLRVPGAVIVSGLILTDKPKSALVAHGFFSSTDVVDGWAARKSKDGPSEFWGKWDPRIDRVYSITLEACLAIKHPTFRKHFAARTSREGLVYGVVRPYFNRKGIDTSATRISKNSTFGATVAQGFEIINFGNTQPAVNEVLQDAATGLKVVSAVKSPKTWINQHAQKTALR